MFVSRRCVGYSCAEKNVSKCEQTYPTILHVIKAYQTVSVLYALMAVSVFIVCLLVFRGYSKDLADRSLLSKSQDFLSSPWNLRSPQLFRHETSSGAGLICCWSLNKMGSKSLPKFFRLDCGFKHVEIPCFYFPSLRGMIHQWAYWMAQPPTGWLLITLW